MSDANEQIIESMFTISRLMREGSVFDAGTLDLTLLQLQTLIFIAKNKQTTMGDIASHFAITLPTATTLIKNLIKVDVVSRKSNKQDKRVVHVVLTAKGKGLLQKAQAVRNNKVTKLLAYLSEGEKTELLKILQVMEQEIEKKS